MIFIGIMLMIIIIIHLILARGPDLVIVTKKDYLLNSWLCLSSWPQSENQRKQKKRQILRSCQGTKNTMGHEGDGDTNCN